MKKEESVTEVKNVELPLKVEELKSFIQSKDPVLYVIKYKDSKIKDTVLFNYISNLNLPVEIDFADCSFEEREKAIASYMVARPLLKPESLRLNVANILLTFRAIDTKDVFRSPIFTREEVFKFIENNRDIVEKWNLFVESSIIFAQKTVVEGKMKEEGVEQPYMEHDYDVIDDINYVGANIVHMFSIPSFLELFFLRKPSQQPKYFKQQFEEFIFKGKNFYHFYANESNDMYGLFLLQANGVVNQDTFKKVAKETQAILENRA